MSDIREFWLIFVLHLRTRLGLSAIKDMTRTSKGKAKLTGFILLALYIAAAMLFTYGMLLYPLMKSAVGVGMGELIFGFVLMLAMIIILALGTLSLLSIVFIAKDAVFYASLPVRPRSVFLAKFGMVYLTELAAAMVFLIPASAIYAMLVDGLTFLFWIKTAVIALLLPVIPLALSGILALPLMLTVGRSRRRDTLTTVISLALLIAISIGQMILSSQMSGLLSNPDKAAELLKSSKALLDGVFAYFPPALWAAKSILFTGADAIGSFLLLLIAVMISLSAAVGLSGKLYYKGVLSGQEAPKASGKKYTSSAVKAGSVVSALVIKEFKLLIRTPVFAMNSFAGVVAFPVMIAVMSFSGGKSESYRMMTEMLATAPKSSLCLAVSGILTFVAIVNPSVSTTFSREGRHFWIIQTNPVPVSTQVFAKLLCGELIAAAGVLLTWTSITFVFGLPLDLALYALVPALSAILPCTAAGMLPDTYHPKLKWNSDAEAMKQNINSLLGMLAGILSLAPAVLTAVGSLFIDVPVVAVVIVISAINTAVSFALLKWLNSTAQKMIMEVEN